MKKIKKIFRKIKSGKVKILCLATILTLLFSVFTVFSSANTVPDTYYPTDDVFTPYPNFTGFSFDYNFYPTDFTGSPVGEQQYGTVYSSQDYFYGLMWNGYVDGEYYPTLDPNSTEFYVTWEGGFYLRFPNKDGIYEDNIFNFTDRLRYYNKYDNAPLVNGKILEWSHLFSIPDVEKFMDGGDTIMTYYEDYFVHRDSIGYLTPLLILTRFNDYTGSIPIDYDVTYDIYYSYFDDDTNSSKEEFVHYYYPENAEEEWLYGLDNYFTVRLTPFHWFRQFFNEHPDIDYIYVNRSDVTLNTYDPDGAPGYFHNVNFYHYLLDDTAKSELKLTSNDFFDSVLKRPVMEHKIDDISEFVTNSTLSFMSFELLPGMTLGGIFAFILGAFIFFYFLRLFAGG